MKVAVLNYSGTVGKTTISAHLLAPRIEGARFFAIETINETASELGVDVEKLKGNKFGELFRELMLEDAAVVDVGASNVEDFLSEMAKYAESHFEFDVFIVPVTPDLKVQKESINTIKALAGVGIPAERIRVIFNRITASVEEECPAILGYQAQVGGFTADPAAAVFENEVFDLLGTKKLTISALMADKTDYRQAIRDSRKKGNAEQLQHNADMHAIKSLALGAHQQLNEVFEAVFRPAV